MNSAESQTAGNNSDGVSTIHAVYDDVTNDLCYSIDWILESTSTDTTNAHFHGPADFGESAGVQLPVALPSVVNDTSGAVSEVLSLDETQEGELLSG